ncbi:MAG: ABC transporter permease [Microbacteriaceae bacterium]|nr:ABC transporter permease [Microbacteriaceae bacterium]
MIGYLARRLATGAFVFVAVTALCFLLLYVRGGEAIARSLLGSQSDAGPEFVAAKAEALGLNRPIPEQYVDWFIGVITGDLGRSFVSNVEVTAIMATRIPITLSLVAVSLLLTVILSVALGVGAATRGGLVDRVLQLLAVAVRAIPGYWLALVLVLVFALGLRLFPATGYVPITTSFGGWLASIFLPSIAIAIGNVASVGTQLRGAMLDVLRQDYVRTLRSRGISERAIVFRHALRNAAAPAFTVLSLEVIGTLGGAVIVERIFALPGLGNLALTSGVLGDIPVVLGVVVFMVVVVVVVNVLVDIINGLLTPKARVG